MGAARSGIAAARMLKALDLEVFVSDSATAELKKSEQSELRAAGIDCEFGGHSRRATTADLAVLSPGIPVASDIVREFVRRQIPVYSEIEVASWFCRSPIIAVTGSNGKTTTTTLIGEMLRKQDEQSIVAGNIGQALSEFVLSSEAERWAVVEVSSFQLETIDRFHPRQAVVLNFAPNHLDRYPSYEAYLTAKWRVTKNLNNQDKLIFNSADALLTDWAGRIEARKFDFNITGNERSYSFYKDEKLFLDGKKLIDVQDMSLRGRHNYMNAMAAAVAAYNSGVSIAHIQEVLTGFHGVEHRLEFVRELDRVKYINDSKATTVESLSFALQSFKEPIILIAGGKDKGSDFTRLNDLIRQFVREIILIGSASAKIKTAWQGLKPIHQAASLAEAVELAHSRADAGNVVLLSPACASFDMFKDFEDRGRQFKQLVHQL